MADRAALLACLACSVGPDRAVASAAVGLGEAEAHQTLPYLQTAAFDSTLRAALKAADIGADDLRERLAQEVGSEPPELVKLRRVTWGTAVQTGLLIVAAFALITALPASTWRWSSTSGATPAGGGSPPGSCWPRRLASPRRSARLARSQPRFPTCRCT